MQGRASGGAAPATLVVGMPVARQGGNVAVVVHPAQAQAHGSGNPWAAGGNDTSGDEHMARALQASLYSVGDRPVPRQQRPPTHGLVAATYAQPSRRGACGGRVDMQQ